MPLRQSWPAAQVAPSGSLPQLEAAHTLPLEQSLLPLQVVKQLVAPQT
jgi:hypothetical protein